MHCILGYVSAIVPVQLELSQSTSAMQGQPCVPSLPLLGQLAGFETSVWARFVSLTAILLCVARRANISSTWMHQSHDHELHCTARRAPMLLLAQLQYHLRPVLLFLLPDHRLLHQKTFRPSTFVKSHNLMIMLKTTEPYSYEYICDPTMSLKHFPSVRPCTSD